MVLSNRKPHALACDLCPGHLGALHPAVALERKIIAESGAADSLNSTTLLSPLLQTPGLLYGQLPLEEGRACSDTCALAAHKMKLIDVNRRASRQSGKR